MNQTLTSWGGSLLLHGLIIAGLLAASNNLSRPVRIELFDFQVVSAPQPATAKLTATPLPPQPVRPQPKPVPKQQVKPVDKKIQLPKPAPAPEAAKPILPPEPLPRTEPLPEPVAAAESAVAEQAELNDLFAETPAAVPGPVTGAAPQVPGVTNSVEAQAAQYVGAHFGYIRDRVVAELRYPLMARRQGWSGQVRVEFTILASGKIRDLKVIKSSGYPMLDRQALRAVEAAVPFPPPPVVATIALPVSFKLN